ncbi:MAG TPA: hypothetical protein DD640_07725 [Clostridiales bacterium]|nr:hypothetical protein [Clostridiales bacterium]
MRKNQFYIALFLVPLCLLSLLNLVWPDQIISEIENRTLSQMPSLKLESLFSGQYTLKFEEYFADQFPFRQFFIGLHQQSMDLLKSPFTGDVALISRPGHDTGTGETLEHDPDDHVILPTATDTGNSTTTPTTLPSGATDPQTTPEPTPVVTEQTQPTEPEATAPAVEGEVESFSAVIIVNGYAMELYYYSENRVSRYAELISRLQAKVPEARIFDLVAPTSLEFHSPEKYHSNSSSQKDAIAAIYAKMPNGVIAVDAYDKLVRHYDEYLYFRSDHHWTARGAFYAYTAFCESAGLEPAALDTMETGFIAGDFLGTLYKYTNSPRLKENPDSVEYFLPTVESQGYAFSSTAMSEGYKVKAVRTEISSGNKYLAFIGGDNPLTHFTTTLTNGKSIVVLKESYGNAFVPFLLNHYQDVYVIDPRSLKADLPEFIRQHGIQDVLILNYTFGVSNTTWNNGFEAMIG